MQEAREMLERVDQIDYNQLRACGAKKKGSQVDIEGNRPMAGQLKNDMIQNRRDGGEEDGSIDVFEGKSPEEQDKEILSSL